MRTNQKEKNEHKGNTDSKRKIGEEERGRSEHKEQEDNEQ